MLLISERDDIEGAKRVSRQEGREEYSGRSLLQGLFIGVLEREREREMCVLKRCQLLTIIALCGLS